MLQNLGKTDLCPIFYLCVSYLSTAKSEPAEVSSGFKSPSKATRNEWLDTTRTTFRIWKGILPYTLLVRVHRQLQAVGENVRKEDAERILDGNTINQLFYTKKITFIKIFFREVNPLSLSAKAALEDVKQRHHEIVELEKTITTMQEIFLDMHTLVESQSEVLDSIKQNVDDTAVNVQRGVVNLKSAADYKKNANRKKVMLAITVIVIMLLLVVAAIVLAIVLSGRT
uniref:t-SNARE coiled-coil homology domain-containing protein n=1 Tax=Heterorhabditis bacteriophora TaxID=37862 RepID=A0A1I7WYA6_HETBA